MLIIILLLASISFIIVSTTKFKLHPFLVLLFTALGFRLFASLSFPLVLQSINEGFGETSGWIEIIILGTFLKESALIMVTAAGGAFSKILQRSGKSGITGNHLVNLA